MFEIMNDNPAQMNVATARTNAAIDRRLLAVAALTGLARSLEDVNDTFYYRDNRDIEPSLKEAGLGRAPEVVDAAMELLFSSSLIERVEFEGEEATKLRSLGIRHVFKFREDIWARSEQPISDKTVAAPAAEGSTE